MLNPLFRFSVTLAFAGACLGADAPFHPGERLEYDLSWGVFHVGSAVLEVEPMTEYAGTPCWHFSLSIRTNSFADAFYKVRSRFDSYVSADLSRTLYYKKIQREGSTNRDVEVFFDWEASTARYVKHEEGRTEERDPIELPGPLHDPLGALFHFRAAPPAAGTTFEVVATDGKKIVTMPVSANKTERVKVDAGRFDSLRFTPETKDLAGVFKKSKDSAIEIWIHNAPSYFPVKLKGKVAVGSFHGELDQRKFVRHE